MSTLKLCLALFVYILKAAVAENKATHEVNIDSHLGAVQYLKIP